MRFFIEAQPTIDTCGIYRYQQESKYDARGISKMTKLGE